VSEGLVEYAPGEEMTEEERRRREQEAQRQTLNTALEGASFDLHPDDINYMIQSQAMVSEAVHAQNAANALAQRVDGTTRFEDGYTFRGLSEAAQRPSQQYRESLEGDVPGDDSYLDMYNYSDYAQRAVAKRELAEVLDTTDPSGLTGADRLVAGYALAAIYGMDPAEATRNFERLATGLIDQELDTPGYVQLAIDTVRWGRIQNRIGNLGTRLFGNVDDPWNDPLYQEILELQQELPNIPYHRMGFFKKVFGRTMEVLSMNVFDQAIAGTAGALIGKGIGAAATAMGLGIPAAVIGGMVMAGRVVGSMQDTARLMGGLSYVNMLQMEDSDGNRVDPRLARAGAIAIMALAAPMELLQMEMVPGMNQLIQRASGRAATTFLSKGLNRAVVAAGADAAQDTIAGALFRNTARLGASWAFEVGIENVQELTEMATTEFVRQLNNDVNASNFDRATLADVGNLMRETTVNSMMAFGGLMFANPMTLVQVGADIRAAGRRQGRVAEVAGKITAAEAAAQEVENFVVPEDNAEAEQIWDTHNESVRTILNKREAGEATDYDMFELGRSVAIMGAIEKELASRGYSLNNKEIHEALSNRPDERGEAINEIIQDSATRQQIRDALPEAVTEDQIDSVVFLADIVSEGLGQDVKTFLTDTVQFTGDVDLAARTANKNVSEFSGKRGATIYLEAGKSLIYASKSADVSTVLHEMVHAAVHVLRTQPTNPLTREMERKFGVTNGEWSSDQIEAVARGAEIYLHNRYAADAEFGGIFERISNWMIRIYKRMKARWDLSPEMVQFYDRFLGTGMERVVPVNREAIYRERSGKAVTRMRDGIRGRQAFEMVNGYGQSAATLEFETDYENRTIRITNLRIAEELYKGSEDELVTEFMEQGMPAGFALDLGLADGVTKAAFRRGMAATGAEVANINAAFGATADSLGMSAQIQVYHGTGAEFERFDMTKILTGEGNNAFGWGLYFTSSEAIARLYAEQVPWRNAINALRQVAEEKGLSHPDFVPISEEIRNRLKGKVSPDIKEMLDNQYGVEEGWDSFTFGRLQVEKNMLSLDLNNLTEDLNEARIAEGFTEEQRAKIIGKINQQIELVTQDLGAFKRAQEEVMSSYLGEEVKVPSILYKVEMQELEPEDFLSWYDEVDQVTIDLLKERALAAGNPELWGEIYGFEIEGYKGRFDMTPSQMLAGHGLYRRIQEYFGQGTDLTQKANAAEAGRKASLFLRDAGIPGVIYPIGTLHAGSKVLEADYSNANFVMFDDQNLWIQDKVSWQDNLSPTASLFHKLATNQSPILMDKKNFEANRAEAAERTYSMMVEELTTAIMNGDKHVLQAQTWYEDDIVYMRDTATREIPQLADNNNWAIFLGLLGITSNGARPRDNLSWSMSAMKYYLRTKKLPIRFMQSVVDANGKVKEKNAWGALGVSISNLFGFIGGPRMWTHGDKMAQYQKLMDHFDNDPKKIADWLIAEHTGAEILEMVGANSIGGMTKTQNYNGFEFIGPKTGQFSMALMGFTDYVVKDKWFTRTWNRYMGTPWNSYNDSYESVSGKAGQMVVDATKKAKEAIKKARAAVAEAQTDKAKEKAEKALSDAEKALAAAPSAGSAYSSQRIAEAPRSTSERRLMEEVVRRVSNDLSQQTGEEFNPSMVQAMLWFYEQQLYTENGVPSDSGSFKEAMDERQSSLVEGGYLEEDGEGRLVRRAQESPATEGDAESAFLSDTAPLIEQPSLTEGLERQGIDVSEYIQLSYQESLEMLFEMSGEELIPIPADVDEDPSQTTQVATTDGTYLKALSYALTRRPEAETVLDYGAGLGLGTQAMRAVYAGLNIESYELYHKRWKAEEPPTYTRPEQMDGKQYDIIISSSVLNVLPEEIRKRVYIHMQNLLKPDGIMVITARPWEGTSGVSKAANWSPGPEVKSAYIHRKAGGGILDVFQKGFDGHEFHDWLEKYSAANVEIMGAPGSGINPDRTNVAVIRKHGPDTVFRPTRPISWQDEIEPANIPPEGEERFKAVREAVAQSMYIQPDILREFAAEPWAKAELIRRRTLYPEALSHDNWEDFAQLLDETEDTAPTEEWARAIWHEARQDRAAQSRDQRNKAFLAVLDKQLMYLMLADLYSTDMMSELSTPLRKIARDIGRGGSMTDRRFEIAMDEVRKNPDTFRNLMESGEDVFAETIEIYREAQLAAAAEVYPTIVNPNMTLEEAETIIATGKVPSVQQRVQLAKRVRTLAARDAVSAYKVKQKAKQLIRQIMKSPSKGVDWEFAAQIHELQEQYDHRGDRRLRAVRRMIAEGTHKVTNPQLDEQLRLEAQKQYLGTMTLTELEAVAKKVKALADQGRAARKAKLAEQTQKIHKAREEMKKVLGWDEDREILGRGSKEAERELRNRIVKGVDFKTLRPERIARLLDGNTEGPFYEWFWTAVNDAVNEHLQHVSDRLAEGDKKMASLGLRPSDLGKQVTVNNMTYSYDQIISMYVGMMDQNSRDAIIYGNKIPYETVTEFISKLPSNMKEWGDWMVDSFSGTNFDRLAEVYVADQNLGLKKVAKYFPMLRQEVYYSTISEQVADDMMARTGRGRPSVGNGFTVSRIKIRPEYQKPIKLGATQIWKDMTAKQEHYISHGLLVKSLNRILKNSPLQDAIASKFGRQASEWLSKYLNDIARPSIYDTMDGLEGISKFLRHNVALAALAFNGVTVLKQAPSLLNFLPYAGPYLIGSLFKMAINPRQTIQRVKSKDPQLANRSYDRLTEEIKRMSAQGFTGVQRAIARVGMAPIKWMDMLVVTAGWDAVYTRSIAKGMSEEEAIQAAQTAVLRTQPAGRAKDLAEIYRSGEGYNWFLMFSNQLNQNWNILTYDAFRGGQGNQLLFGFSSIMSLALGAMAIGAIARKGFPDEPREFAEDLFFGMVAAVPLIGRGIQSAYQGFDGGVEIIPVGEIGRTINELFDGDGFDDLGDNVGRMLRDAARVIGLPGSVPATRTVTKMIENANDGGLTLGEVWSIILLGGVAEE
jgi:hypothetical protein